MCLIESVQCFKVSVPLDESKLLRAQCKTHADVVQQPHLNLPQRLAALWPALYSMFT